MHHELKGISETYKNNENHLEDMNDCCSIILLIL